MCSAPGDGQKADDWSKVACSIHGSLLRVVCPTEGLLHSVELSQCSSVDKVPGCVAEKWHHISFRPGYEVFNPEASFCIKQTIDGSAQPQAPEALYFTAPSIEEFDMWMQALTFHTHTRRILHGDAVPFVVEGATSSHPGINLVGSCTGFLHSV